MVTLATPFLLVLALYFLPLNLKVIFLPLTALPLIFKVALKTSFLADFLTLTFLRVSLILVFLAGVTGFLATVNEVVFSL